MLPNDDNIPFRVKHPRLILPSEKQDLLTSSDRTATHLVSSGILGAVVDDCRRRFLSEEGQRVFLGLEARSWSVSVIPHILELGRERPYLAYCTVMRVGGGQLRWAVCPSHALT